MNNGLLVVISSPSGGGKTTIIRKIVERDPQRCVYSISATTRAPRSGEQNGKDYYFLDDEAFQAKIEQGEFLEWERVHGYYYGTDLSSIQVWLQQGKVVLLDLDVKGALQVANILKDQTVTIFIAPPSLDTLIKRLKNRKTDSNEEIEKRLERIPMEMEKSKKFDAVIVNENLDKTVDQVLKIIENHIH
ncbi:MAG TPA: guanylate kinase [bacterium]|nr:guanylate kinase [bacterium]